LVADVATTEESAVSVPGLGLGLTVQAVPSQCSMSVASPLPDSVNPTAHTSVADLAKTDWNGALWLAGEGLNCPGGAVPVLDQRPETGGALILADRPHVGGRYR
jgi:hypothetical protein